MLSVYKSSLQYFRFAKFVEGASHLADNEILAYQTESKKAMDELFTDDSDETEDE